MRARVLIIAAIVAAFLAGMLVPAAIAQARWSVTPGVCVITGRLPLIDSDPPYVARVYQQRADGTCADGGTLVPALPPGGKR